MKRLLPPAMVICLLCAPAGSQQNPAAPDALAGAEQAQQAAEDLELLRALAAADFTGAALQRLLPMLEDAQRRLRQQEAADASELQALRSGLVAERRQALAGVPTAGPMEQRYRQTVAAQRRRQRALRDELVASVRRSLLAMLTPEQLARLGTAGEQLAREHRRADLQAQIESGGPGFAGFITGALDRLRALPPAQWEELRQAARSGDFRRVVQLGGGPGFRLLPDGERRFLVQPVPDGAPPQDVPRGRPLGAPGPRIDVNHPQFRAAVERMLGLAERVRGLSGEDYAAQRPALAAELQDEFRNLMEVVRRASENPQITARRQSEALDAFIERYLLHPRAPELIRQKLGAAR